MKATFFTVFAVAFLLSCGSSDETKDKRDNGLLDDLRGIATVDEVSCPEGGHKDSILEIVYGEPSEDLFAAADSGLVMLGGCEIMDENYWCQRHDISFEFP